MRQLQIITLTALSLCAWAPASRIEYQAVLQFPFDGDGLNYGSYVAHDGLDLNDKGHVIGRIPENGYWQCFFWSKETGVVLLDQPNYTANVFAINNHDQIAGEVVGLPSYRQTAALWDPNGIRTDVGTVFGGQDSSLKDINDKGVAVGYISTGNSEEVFIRTPNGDIHYPGIISAHTWAGLEINNAGQIAGFTQHQPFRWCPEKGLELLKMPGDTALTLDNFRLIIFSDSGRVVVSSPSYQQRGTYFWDDPNEPILLDDEPLSDLNIYGQHVQREWGFNDGQYSYSHLGNCSQSIMPGTLPFSSIASDPNRIPYCHLYFDKINKQGQILTNGMEPYISCLWEPIRIAFDDVHLVGAIIDQLDLQSEPNYVNVLEMTRLNAYNRGIESLAGLEYAFNLDFLDVRNNPLDKRSVCYTLETLRRQNPDIIILYDSHLYNDCAVEFGDMRVKQQIALQLAITEPNYFNVMSDRLRNLAIHEVNDLSGLENVVYLQEFSSSSSTFTDVNDLSELYSLINLSIIGNQNLSDISSLRKLSYLEKLALPNCSIPDIRPLLQLENLRELNLQSNPIDPIMACEVIPQIYENNERLYQIYYSPLWGPIDGCTANLHSISHISGDWLRQDCTRENDWCYGADINQDGSVDLDDLRYVAYFWLAEEVYW